jgi:hypothetical protein
MKTKNEVQKKLLQQLLIIILDSIVPARSGKTRILLSVPKALFKRRWWQ